jgi:L-amino acid N-acyltransferase YncA
MTGVDKPVIRAAAAADIPRITAIYADAVLTGTATFELEPPGATEMAARMKGLVDGGYPYFVADHQGGVAGYAYAGPYRPRIGYRYTVEDSVYLAPDARGLGMGGALLAKLIATCEAAGFRQMIAVIGDSGNQASIRLHAAAGFVPAGNFKDVGYKFERWIDTVLMQRPLGMGARSKPVR